MSIGGMLKGGKGKRGKCKRIGRKDKDERETDIKMVG
jgi:hypothetical protein